MLILFALGTVISLFIVYKDIKNTFSTKFVIGYVIFAFLFLIYFVVISIINAKNLSRFAIRKRLLKFIIIFITCWFLLVLITYLAKGQVNILDKVSVPLGSAFGISFLDLAFINKKEK